MKVHTHLYPDKRRLNSRGKYFVKIYINHFGKQKLEPTGVEVTDAEWESIICAKPKGPYKEIRMDLDAKLAKVRAVIDSLPVFTYSLFKKALNKPKRSAYNIFPFFDEEIIERRADHAVNTVGMYDRASKSLRRFRSQIGFYDIDIKFLKDYQKWMTTQERSPTTISMYLRCLRCIYNKAIVNGIIGDTDQNPFRRGKYVMPQPRNVKKALTFEEITQIATFTEFSSKTEATCLDYFLFSYLCNGLNMADIFRLRWTQLEGDVIRFYRQKTRKKVENGSLPITITLHPKAVDIINRLGVTESIFIFGLIDEDMDETRKVAIIHQKTKIINQYMKQVATKLKISKPVTTYTARHTFAQTFKNNGESVELIAEALGHQNTRTTRAYLASFAEDKLREATKRLL